MATFRATDADSPFNMAALSTVVDDVNVTNPDFFNFFNAAGDQFSAIGDGFTYNGAQPTGGNVTNVQIDLVADGLASPNDFVIFGLSGVDLAKLDNGTQPFWNEVLKGDDTFDLSGLDQAQVGAGRNVIFGDDSSSALSPNAGIVTDTGGDDAITGADNEFDLLGDVFTVAGFAIPGRTLFAKYDAGDDTITGGARPRRCGSSATPSGSPRSARWTAATTRSTAA